MIKSVKFQNFKALRDAELPLAPFTLLVGANGSGKSTALEALIWLRDPQAPRDHPVPSAGSEAPTKVEVRILWSSPFDGAQTVSSQDSRSGSIGPKYSGAASVKDASGMTVTLSARLNTIRILSLEARAIAAKVHLQPKMILQSDGAGLAGVLDRLRDTEPERFQKLNIEMGRWFPEFDQITFDTPEAGYRSFSLRTRATRHSIPATALSHGTLLALAMLTLAYVPDVPAILCLEEPDRGIHPRLLRDVKDAIYRLCYPAAAGEDREPVQVIATTHSPYFLDLFKDHPEEVVLAHKNGIEATFTRLSDRPDLQELLHDASLGEIWYTGILGGVPTGT